MHAFSGVITWSTLTYFLLTLPAVLLGTFAGSRISGRINRRTYLRTVYLLLMGLGIVMLAG